MKKQISAIAIASIFAITPLFAVAATHLSAGNQNVQASADHQSLQDLRDVGSGQYGGQASVDHQNLDDLRDIGSGQYGGQA